MRHLVKGRKLGRTTSHRKATIQALSVALIQHERITTTLAKAKELRMHVEPIITRSKNDTTHNRRIAFSFLRDKNAVTKLFTEIGELVADRPGGYTRIIKLGKRAGDNADVAMIELVDYNDEAPATTSKKKKRTRRAGRGKTTESTPAKVDQSEKEKPAKETSTVDTSEASQVSKDTETVNDQKTETKADKSVDETADKKPKAAKSQKKDDKTSDAADAPKEK